MQNETSDRDLHSDLFPNFFENLFPDRNNNNIDEEPLYVNAKQYFRILKRRVARTRLEEVHRLSRQRKPYLHESRHKHAMRRPRGPGGRFLTAEEIAAQKNSAQDLPSHLDHDMDDENIQMSPEPDRSPIPSPSPMPIQPSFLQQQQQQSVNVNVDYHHRHFPAPQKQTPPLYPQQPQAHHHHQQHQAHTAVASSSKGTMNSAPITLSPPYPAAMQMHHVPHPHAHARQHHSNFSYQMYASPSDLEMQRRTEEMIQFGTSGPSSS